MSSITTAKKDGANPVVLVCRVCAEEIGVAPPGGLADDQAGASRIYADSPCEQCAKYMEQGIVLISVRDGESGQNPYRTGSFCVLKEELIEKMIQDEVMRGEILRARVAFIQDKDWRFVGLPTRREH